MKIMSKTYLFIFISLVLCSLVSSKFLYNNEHIPQIGKDTGSIINNYYTTNVYNTTNQTIYWLNITGSNYLYNNSGVVDVNETKLRHIFANVSIFTNCSSGQFIMNLTPTGGQCSSDTETSSSTMNVQEFTSNGQWTKPNGVSMVHIVCVGAGGGGGGGRIAAANAARTGGGGGGGGSVTLMIINASELPSKLNITIGIGGKGGNCSGITCTPSSGGNGENTTIFNASNSNFIYLKCYGGGGGLAGTTAVVAGGGGASTYNSASGATGGSPIATTTHGIGGQGITSPTSGVVYGSEWGGGAGSYTSITTISPGGAASIYGCPGGGAGAGLTTAQVVAHSSAGAKSGFYPNTLGGAAGLSGNLTATDGSSGVNIMMPYCGSGGGGGGAVNFTRCGSSNCSGSLDTYGRNGGDGGFGAGGGGAGAGTNNATTGLPATGGFGGKGGNGLVMIWAW